MSSVMTELFPTGDSTLIDSCLHTDTSKKCNQILLRLTSLRCRCSITNHHRHMYTGTSRTSHNLRVTSRRCDMM